MSLKSSFPSESHSLYAVGAVDGRYAEKTKALMPYFSEAGLIRYRIITEAQWLLHLCSDPIVSKDIGADRATISCLERLISDFPENAAAAVKAHEAVTNHDVKAVEYYLRDVLKEAGARDSVLAFIHFGCTSEDINNVSYALLLRDARDNILAPKWRLVIEDLQKKAEQYRELPMLARTHGQTASPTTLGKELAVFGHRLWKQYRAMLDLKFEAKMNGAVGNYNAHMSAYPNVDWPETTKRFIEDRLGLTQNTLTTQIENHDSMIAFCDNLRRTQNIAIGLCRDIWTYISLAYFTQKTIKGEVGSSTMPHKVNPIDFENAEGNFGLANGILAHLSDKLLISRLQRDLSDSTVQRSFGTILGHSLIALASLQKGLAKIVVNEQALEKDLQGAWEVLAEPVQTIMRRYGIMNAYERLKEQTRGQAVTKESLHELIKSTAEIPSAEKEQLLQLTPSRYIGLAAELCQRFVEGRS